MMDIIMFWVLIMTGSILYGTAEGDNFDKGNVMEGLHLVIATIHNNPYVLLEHTGANISQVNGFLPDVVEWMAKKHKFTFEYVEPPDGAFGAFENGSWNGVVGMVVRREVQMAMTALSVTYLRSLAVDFTIPFSEEPVSLLIPYPQLEGTITRIIKPFQSEVWLGFILSLFIAAMILRLISRYEMPQNSRSSRREQGGFSYAWFLFRVLANPDEDIIYTLAKRLVVAAWCLMAVVLVNSYTSSLVSYLMAPKYVSLMNTIQDLAESKEISLIVLKHTSMHSELLAAKYGVLKRLGDRLRADPQSVLTSLENLHDIIFSQYKAFPTGETPSKLRMDRDFKATGQCRLSIAKESLFPDQLAIAMTKYSPLTNIFNIEYGMIFPNIGFLTQKYVVILQGNDFEINFRKADMVATDGLAKPLETLSFTQTKSMLSSAILFSTFNWKKQTIESQLPF